MKSLILLFVLFTASVFAQNLFAAPPTESYSCGERLRSALDGEKVEIEITRDTYKLAAAARRHYRKELGAYSESPFEISIDSAAEYRSPDGTVVGFKISITDGGDESMVDYILDHNRKLVSAYWHNQSPMRYWFCR